MILLRRDEESGIPFDPTLMENFHVPVLNARTLLKTYCAEKFVVPEIPSFGSTFSRSGWTPSDEIERILVVSTTGTLTSAVRTLTPRVAVALKL